VGFSAASRHVRGKNRGTLRASSPAGNLPPTGDVTKICRSGGLPLWKVQSWYTLGGYTSNSCHHPLVTSLAALDGL
jgi:hypothetical protein